MKKDIKKISELITFISQIGKKTDNLLVFRGAKKDYGDTALDPFVYRGYINNEDVIYRESQRFNDFEFTTDKTAFDKLSRIQHYSAPTRLIDVSEDLFSAIYFAINEEEKCKCKEDKNDAVVYIIEIDRKKIKYYDSDAVSVIANLAKIPLKNSGNKKSKKHLVESIKEIIDSKNVSNINNQEIGKFNGKESVKFLLHEIKEEKPQFESIINPKHLTSVQFVLPKLTNNRVRSQKGAFLLFGLNPNNYEKSIKLIENNQIVKSDKIVNHPIVKLHTAYLKHLSIPKMQKELEQLGIRTTFIYPEIDKVSKYLERKFKS